MGWRWLSSRLRQAFWFIPAVCVVAAIGLALALQQLDEGLQRHGGGFAFAGGPEAARTLLSAIASSMLTLTALVFSITVVVLQLTSSQFSPRVVRTFLRDRQNQITLGVFIATFVYALMALREVRGQASVAAKFVPGVTISVAFGLTLISVGLFVAYIHHIANSIRLITIVTRIRRETESAIDRLAPADGDPVPIPLQPHGASEVVAAGRSGVVAAIDIHRLVHLGAKADAVVWLRPRVGDYVPVGAPLLSGSSDQLDEDDLHEAIDLADERDTDHDIAFGLRLLVDIAERALSPGINDPSTAVQCLDQLHTLLRLLGTRPLPSGAYADADGIVRLVVPVTSWDDYVALACDEIRHWGASSLQIHRRLRALLQDLLEVVAVERRPPLRRQLALLDARAADLPDTERPAATTPARRGTSDANDV